MKKLIFVVFTVLSIGCKPSIYLQKDAIQLSDPKIIFENSFFENNTKIKISPTAKKANLFYSVSNGEMHRYKEPILIEKSTKIVAKAIGGGYLPSDTSEIELIKLPKSEIVSIKSGRALNKKYGKSGLDILIDRKKGALDFNEGWLGYAGDTIVFDLEFDVIEVDHVVISTLRNQDAWIFSPANISIHSSDKKIGEVELKESLDKKSNGNIFTKINVKNTNTQNLKIEIIAPKGIPAWHPGAGTKPWIFIDEILIY